MVRGGHLVTCPLLSDELPERKQMAHRSVGDRGHVLPFSGFVLTLLTFGVRVVRWGVWSRRDGVGLYYGCLFRPMSSSHLLGSAGKAGLSQSPGAWAFWDLLMFLQIERQSWGVKSEL